MWVKTTQLYNDCFQYGVSESSPVSTLTFIVFHLKFHNEILQVGKGGGSSVNVVVTTKPSFVKMLPSLSGAPIHRTKKVWLTCVVECSPLCSISWYSNNSLLTNSTLYQVLTETLDTMAL